MAGSAGELDWVNNIAVVEIEERRICIASHRDQWFGFAFKCPHAGVALSDGYIDIAGNIVCPLHGYKFSLKNGYNTSGEGYYLKTYPVNMNDEGIFVGLEETGGQGY